MNKKQVETRVLYGQYILHILPYSSIVSIFRTKQWISLTGCHGEKADDSGGCGVHLSESMS